MSRTHHLQEDRLLDCYLGVRTGESPDPPVLEHLTDCDECGGRYAELARFMETLRVEAVAETDAIFSPERLRAQQQHIARRIEHLSHPARVLSFPKHMAAPRLRAGGQRSARRWVAAAAAAGLFIGVGTGLFLDWEGARAVPIGGGISVARQTLRSAPAVRIDLSHEDPFEGEDAFLSEVEIAGERPRTRELVPFDALTPHVREVTLR
jgi:predicted anti-sigma-YlaC factor YlaD